MRSHPLLQAVPAATILTAPALALMQAEMVSPDSAGALSGIAGTRKHPKTSIENSTRLLLIYRLP
jgi:hypothetical protein